VQVLFLQAWLKVQRNEPKSFLNFVFFWKFCTCCLSKFGVLTGFNQIFSPLLFERNLHNRCCVRVYMLIMKKQWVQINKTDPVGWSEWLTSVNLLKFYKRGLCCRMFVSGQQFTLYHIYAKKIGNIVLFGNSMTPGITWLWHQTSPICETFILTFPLFLESS